MTKRELANAVAEELELSKKDGVRAVDVVFEEITRALKRGERVSVPGFGIFAVRDRPARMGRNPQTGEPIRIPASRKVAFRASKDLKLAVGATRRKR